MIEIVNVSQNWAIGRQGQLFINIPEDMKFFRETTKGKVCIMGSTTLESFPNMAPLKNRGKMKIMIGIKMDRRLTPRLRLRQVD